MSVGSTVGGGGVGGGSMSSQYGGFRSCWSRGPMLSFPCTTAGDDLVGRLGGHGGDDEDVVVIFGGCAGSGSCTVDNGACSAAAILSTQMRDSISFHLLIAVSTISFPRSVVAPSRLIPNLLEPRKTRSWASVRTSWFLVDSHSVGLCWNSEPRRVEGSVIYDGEDLDVVVGGDGECPIPKTAPRTR